MHQGHFHGGHYHDVKEKKRDEGEIWEHSCVSECPEGRLEYKKPHFFIPGEDMQKIDKIDYLQGDRDAQRRYLNRKKKNKEFHEFKAQYMDNTKTKDRFRDWHQNEAIKK